MKRSDFGLIMTLLWLIYVKVSGDMLFIIFAVAYLIYSVFMMIAEWGTDRRKEICTPKNNKPPTVQREAPPMPLKNVTILEGEVKFTPIDEMEVRVIYSSEIAPYVGCMSVKEFVESGYKNKRIIRTELIEKQ